ncbi:MAG: hypothetical protein CL986_02775 [Euryarchaeota archaeon]|nr:hypothetical protein [Euryarchaeota archaeon]
MSFEGRVSRESHEGGLLIAFEGRAPRLGARLCVTGGQTLGKVETVLGPADEPLVHLYPLANGIEGSKVIGSPVEIAPRLRRDSRKPRRMGEYRGRREGSQNSRSSTVKSGDWICPKCKNHNFANKKVCNRSNCEQPKPRGGGGRRDTRRREFGQSRGHENPNMKPGDWNCPKCKNHNFAKRDVCNRCDTRKPVAGKGSRKTPGRQRRPNPRDNWKPRGRGRGRGNGR